MKLKADALDMVAVLLKTGVPFHINQNRTTTSIQTDRVRLVYNAQGRVTSVSEVASQMAGKGQVLAYWYGGEFITPKTLVDNRAKVG